jgi:hypothetical protein
MLNRQAAEADARCSVMLISLRFAPEVTNHTLLDL